VETGEAEVKDSHDTVPLNIHQSITAVKGTGARD